MSGGKGTRMKSSEEKLLLKYKQPIIQHVLSAFINSEIFSKIVCITSNNAPRTREFVSRLGIDMIETHGEGYVEDLGEALLNFNEPVFVASGDMPLLDSEIIKQIIKSVNEKDVWTSVLVRKKFLDSLGLEAEFFVTCDGEKCAYTGISVVNPGKIDKMEYIAESYVIFDDKRVATNLNTNKEYDLFCAT